MANTPNRIMRIPDDVWDRFGDVCAAEGTDRTKSVIAFMRRKIRAHQKAAGASTDAAPNADGSVTAIQVKGSPTADA